MSAPGDRTGKEFKDLGTKKILMPRHSEDVKKEELEKKLLIACDNLYFGAGNHYKAVTGGRFSPDLVSTSSVKATIREDFACMLKDMTLQTRSWNKWEQLAVAERLRLRAGKEVLLKGWSPVYPWVEKEPYFSFFLAVMAKDPVYRESGKGIEFGAKNDFTLEDVKPIAAEIVNTDLQQNDIDGAKQLETRSNGLAELEEKLESFEEKFGSAVKKEELENLGKELEGKIGELTEELNKLASYIDGYSFTKEILKRGDEIGKREK